MDEAKDGGRRARGDAPDGFRGARAGESGVTLIEVMIALVVLAFGLLAVAGMAGAVAMQTRMAGSVTGQTAAGQEVLEELQMKGYGHSDLTPTPLGSEPPAGTRQVTLSSWTYTVDYYVESVGTGLKEVVAVVEGTRDLPPDTVRTLVARMDGPPPIP